MANGKQNKQGILEVTGSLVRRDFQIQTMYERKESTNNRRKDRKQEAGKEVTNERDFERKLQDMNQIVKKEQANYLTNERTS